MKLTLFTANTIGNAGNTSYPNKVVITSEANMKKAVRFDHVCAEYKNHYRKNEYFLQSDNIPMDVDNTHSENPEDWVKPEDMDSYFTDVAYVIVPSRHNLLPKGTPGSAGYTPRPRFHVYFITGTYTDADAYNALKIAIQKEFPFFDADALGAARFLFGAEATSILWHDGSLTIESLMLMLGQKKCIPEGQRNATLSRFAGKVIIRFGVTEKAHQMFLERAAACEPPLPESELNTIWKSAVRFGNKIAANPEYIPPEAYTDPENDPLMLLNTPGGTYDLSQGVAGWKATDPKDYLTKVTAVVPSTDEAEMQLWQEALQTFFCGDDELIDYVQKICGMTIIGRVYVESMIIAYGDGRNGKSTFWNVLYKVLGSYAGNLSADALTVNCKRNVKPEMAELKGKRLIIASELQEGTRLNTSVVKQLCSTDPIFAEKKFKAPFSFEPSHTLVLYTNHLPKVSASDDGTWRRLIVIPFHAKIEGKSDIKNYTQYLVEHAGGAVLAWLMEGAKRAIQANFQIPRPKCVLDATGAYKEANDWLSEFLGACCEVGERYSEKSGELYQAYTL